MKKFFMKIFLQNFRPFLDPFRTPNQPKNLAHDDIYVFGMSLSKELYIKKREEKVKKQLLN